MLKNKTSFFGRARKIYILKFGHNELTIDGDIHSKNFGQCT